MNKTDFVVEVIESQAQLEEPASYESLRYVFLGKVLCHIS
jgi:hypothetical protein